MFEYNSKRAQKAGLPPGTLVHVGEERTEAVTVSRYDFTPEICTVTDFSSMEECLNSLPSDGISWINIDGVHNTGIMSLTGTHFGIHPLVLEDMVNTTQRPKIEDHGDYIFLVLKMMTYHDDDTVDIKQVSLIFGERYVLSFQEKPGDLFDPIRRRLKQGKGRIRNMGPDYLTYSLIDVIVDGYFAILERLGERVEDLEDALIDNPPSNIIHEIHGIKRELLLLRKSLWPLREVINFMTSAETPLIKKEMHLFLRDVYDHTIQVIDTLETMRDMVGGMIDLYLSSTSNRMNEVMKVLTIIATIFIPLTFVAGIYGMNFSYMPELNVRWGYFATLGAMFAIVLVMLYFFKRKGWF